MRDPRSGCTYFVRVVSRGSNMDEGPWADLISAGKLHVTCPSHTLLLQGLGGDVLPQCPLASHNAPYTPVPSALLLSTSTGSSASFGAPLAPSPSLERLSPGPHGPTVTLTGMGRPAPAEN